MDVIAMLCDHAQVEGGKLFVSGAGISLVGAPPVGPPYPVSVALAALVTIPWTATNQQHTLTIELVSEVGGGSSERVAIASGLPPGADPADEGKIVAQFTAGRSPIMHAGDDSLMPIAVPLHGLPLPRPGDYFFQFAVNGTPAARVSFRLQPAGPVVGMAPPSPTSF